MLFRFEKKSHSPHGLDALLTRAQIHLAMQGFECVDMGPPLVFRRGSRRGGLSSLDVRNFPHEITLNAEPQTEGALYNSVYEARTIFPMVFRREMEFWRRESEELEDALLGSAELPLHVTAPDIAAKGRLLKIVVYSLIVAASFLAAIFFGTYVSRKLLMAYTEEVRPHLISLNLALSFAAYVLMLLGGWFVLKFTLAWKEPPEEESIKYEV